MKKLYIISLLVLIGTIAKSQTVHDLKNQIRSQNWSLKAGVKFNEKNFDEIYPIYTLEIKKHNGKPFQLKGYLIPVDKTKKHSRFLLSALPLNQCNFCGKDGIPLLVLVTINSPIDFSLKPISISGTLNLQNGNVLDGMPIVLSNSKLTQ